jgi:hypothetical protein
LSLLSSQNTDSNSSFAQSESKVTRVAYSPDLARADKGPVTVKRLPARQTISRTEFVKLWLSGAIRGVDVPRSEDERPH